MVFGGIAVAVLGFIGSRFGIEWLVFGGVGLLLMLIVAGSGTENTAKLPPSPYGQTEALSEAKPRGILRKTQATLVGFIVLAIILVGLSVSFAPKPQGVSPLDVIGIFNPLRYIVKKELIKKEHK